MKCPYCGNDVPSQAHSCPNCGSILKDEQMGNYQNNNHLKQQMYQPSYTQPAQQPAQQVPVEPVQAKPMPMKWYKFVIYFQLFASALLSLVNAITVFTGAQYGEDADLVYAFYSGLRIVDILMAVLSLGAVVFAIYVRQQLRHFKRTAPQLYFGFLLYNVVISVVYAVGASLVVGENLLDASIISNIATNLVIAALCNTYFKKRAHLFVN